MEVKVTQKEVPEFLRFLFFKGKSKKYRGEEKKVGLLKLSVSNSRKKQIK